MSAAETGQAIEPLWTAGDVRDFLKVSLSWVYLRAASGELPGRRIGGLWRFEGEKVRAYARGETSRPVVVALPKRGG